MALAGTTWSTHITICTHGEPQEIDEAELWDKLDACNISVVSRDWGEARRDTIFSTLAQHAGGGRTINR